MSAAAIRAFGVATLVFDAAILFVAAGPRARMFGPLPKSIIISALVFCLTATTVGVGLLFLRKWAAVIFSLALIVLTTWMAVVASIAEVPSAFCLMIVATTLVLVLPIIIIVRSWRLLSWRGKWFF